MSETYCFRGFYIPEYMLAGIKRYIEKGHPPGAFLTAIITNNLRDAMSLADDETLNNMPAYVAYFSNHAPSGCYGYPGVIEDWRAHLMQTENYPEAA